MEKEIKIQMPTADAIYKKAMQPLITNKIALAQLRREFAKVGKTFTPKNLLHHQTPTQCPPAE